MFLKTRALVLREVKYKEADRILTLLTEAEGKLTAKARGALRKGSRFGAATEALCWSELTLFGNRGRWSVNEAALLEPFLPLRQDIEKLALGSYMAELLEAVSDVDRPDRELLRFGLNSLFALAADRYPQGHIRSVFELKLLCLSGFQPWVESCAVCGKETPERPCFSPAGGTVHCLDCPPGAPGETIPLSGAVLRALRYVVAAPPERAYAFSMPAAAETALGRVTETFAAAQLERSFGTLDYWKTLRMNLHGSL